MVALRLSVSLSRSCWHVIKRRSHNIPALVSTDWLKGQIGPEGHSKPDHLRIVEASWDFCVNHNTSHIPGSVCFDGERCRDLDSPFKNMLPKPEIFAEYVGASLGIDNESHVIIYDASGKPAAGLSWAPRVWYMFRVFGHDAVSVLDGGLWKWIMDQGILTTMASKAVPATFKANYRPELVSNFEDVKKIVDEGDASTEQLIDARGKATHSGIEPSYDHKGCIPGSNNVTLPSLMNQKTDTMMSPEQLEHLFRHCGLSLSSPMISTCGSGMNASAVALALYQAGLHHVPVYDGSWYEWTRRHGPIEVKEREE